MMAEKLRAFLWGTLAGFTITAALLLPRWHPYLTDEDLLGLIAQRDQLAAALDKQNQNLADCTEKMEQGSGSTLLYETEPASPQQSALQVIGQLATGINCVTYAEGATCVATPHNEPLPRWVIPGRVQPILLGPSRGAVYYHIAPGKSVAERHGPFVPAGPPAGHSTGGRP